MKTKPGLNHIYLLNEFTDACNLKCIMCDHGRFNNVHGKHPFGTMDEGLFEKMIDRFKNSSVHLDCFHAGWLGEPLCHPRFNHMIKTLFGQDKTYNFFDSFTMNTNAILLNRELSDIFLDYAEFLEMAGKGFFRIHLSIHAAGEAMYQKMTQKTGKNINLVLNNIEYLLDQRRKRGLRFPNLTFLFVVTKTNQREAKKFLKFWSKKLSDYGKKYEVSHDWPENDAKKDIDAIYFRREDAYEQYEAEELHKKTAYNLGLIPKAKIKERIIRTDAVLRKNALERHDAFRRPCPALWRTLVVHNSGLAVPCCSDLHLELVIGDLKYQSLDEIWNGPQITDMRLTHIRGDFQKYKRCYYCNNIDSFVISNDEIAEYLKDVGQEGQIAPFLERMRDVRYPSCQVNKNTLNICLVSREYPPETGWGGIGTYTYQLAHGLAKKGHNIHVIALGLEKDSRVMDSNIHIHRISHRDLFTHKRPFSEFAIRLEYSYRLYKKLKEIIKRYDIDLVEAPNFFAESFVYGLFKKVPLVIRLHSPFFEIIKSYGWANTADRRLSCFLEDAAILHADLITSSTHICAQAMAKRLGINSKKIDVFPLGIQLPHAPVPQDSNHSTSNGKLNVLFVGRLEYRKGFHVLMRAIPYVLERYPLAHFTFIGRDTFINSRYSSFKGKGEESVKDSLLKDFPRAYKNNLTFLGHVDQEVLSQHLMSCDLFVAPSLYETFGLVYVEAMSYAKPVIGCAVGGVPEVIKDEETGILVPSGDHSSLGQAIIQLLNNPETRIKMGKNARRDVENNFTIEHMVENTLAAYKKVLKIS